MTTPKPGPAKKKAYRPAKVLAALFSVAARRKRQAALTAKPSPKPQIKRKKPRRRSPLFKRRSPRRSRSLRPRH